MQHSLKLRNSVFFGLACALAGSAGIAGCGPAGTTTDLAAMPDTAMSTSTDMASLPYDGPDLAPKVTQFEVGPNGTLVFQPNQITINVGDSVIWKWDSSGHNVVSGINGVPDNKFCSPMDQNCATAPTQNTGFSYTFTFKTLGSYPFYCAPHVGAGMRGTVLVQ